MEFVYELKIPKERIAVLIGKDGETKNEIEEETNAKIFIDSKEGFVKITGEDSISLYTAREIIKSIARGFNPEIAKLLLRTEYVLLIIELADFVSKSQKGIERLRGRVIGTEGKSRRAIEQYTETYVAVYGKTIGIIGEAENVELARTAIDNLLTGSPHSAVYRWLEKKRKALARKKVFETTAI